MSEVTVVCNAQITLVVNDWDEEHLPFDERGIVYALKDMLGADDVVVSDLKHFEREED